VGGGVSIEAMNHVWKSTPYSPKYSGKGIPSLLASGYFIQVHPEIIRKLGSATQAIVLQQLSYWLERSTKEHDGENWVYNSYENWAENLGLSASQVKRAMLVLEELGLIISCQPEAYNRVKWYRIDIEHEFWDDSNVRNAPFHETKSSDGTDEIVPSTSYTNTTQREPNKPNKDFEEFWDIYPRKVGKAQAHKAFPKALKKIPFQDLLAGVKLLASDPKLDLTFCPHPASWLNGERWEDVREQVKIKVTHLPPRYDPLELDNPKAIPMPESVRKLLGSAFSGGLGVGEG
jgi:hypothetical protein